MRTDSYSFFWSQRSSFFFFFFPWKSSWTSLFCVSLLQLYHTSQVALLVKSPSANAGEAREEGWIPGWGRSPGGECGNTLQYSCLEKFPGQRSLAGYSSWGHKESDTTEQLTLSLFHYDETSSPKILTYLLWDRQICLSALGDSNGQSEFRRTRLSYEKL